MIALYAIPAVAAMKPIVDPDIWWHLRTGQWIVEHGTVPMTDPFSSYGLGKPWIAYSWLFEVLVYGLYSWLGLLGILAFRTKRDAWFVVMAAVALITTAPSTTTLTERFALTKLRVLLVAWAVIAVLIVVGRVRNISQRHFESAFAEKYPVAAAAAVEERGYPGPLYNHFNWGGYLIWRLRDLPVAMDGRTNLHGDERIKRSLETWTGKNTWASDPDLAAARLVISGVDWPLASLLRLDPRFELVYADAVAVVFIPRPQHGGP